jgi:hypothetical protein
VPLVAVADATCIACHAALETTRPAPVVQATLKRFADHPIFRPLRAGTRDEAALRFNHHLHLTSPRIPERDRLTCASCHVAAPDGALMRPVAFADQCQRCHPQEVQGPVGTLAVLHAAPDRVRADLEAKLLALALDDPGALFGDRPSRIPGRRRRAPIDRSASLREYRDQWLTRLEAELYRPYAEPAAGATVLQTNERCFLCHLEGAPAEPPGVATIAPTLAPQRWLAAAAFSHRPHQQVECAHCHATSAGSVATDDVNLPGLAVCAGCHADASGRTAGTDCVLCHRYHAR